MKIFKFLMKKFCKSVINVDLPRNKGQKSCQEMHISALAELTVEYIWV